MSGQMANGNRRVLLFGPSGQVGSCLLALGAAGCEWVAVDRSRCDLSNAEDIRAVVLEVEPHLIVNAAAYTAVDKAESDAAACFQVNAAAPEAMARSARELGIPLVHYSTDYVFNGAKNGPYREEDATGPLGVYGSSKLEGEQRIAAVGGRFLILRTSWVYGARGHNFLKTMLRLGQERPELRIVSDQVGAPTAATAIAEATLRVIEQGRDASGVFHMTAAGSTSWFGFAEAIFDHAGMAKMPKLTPISTEQYPTPARRPQNSVLSNEKFLATFGFQMPPWEDQLKRVMREIRSEQPAALPGVSVGESVSRR